VGVRWIAMYLLLLFRVVKGAYRGLWTAQANFRSLRGS
jgi:hypothetical protein